jgi:fumarylpyruvate hydrolase
MTETPFSLSPRPTVPIEGGAEFPVGRIFCVGRNYAAHAREMGKDPDRDPPFFFTKFADTLVIGGGNVPYPPETSNYHFEAELVVAIGKVGAALSEDNALDVVFGYAVGLDMTRRDLQLESRDKGRPWDTGKNFAYSAPISSIRPLSAGGHADEGPIQLTVNGELKQDADLRDLIWSTPEIIVHLSRLERLLPGDLIFTGTPAGVGPVVPGDIVRVTIEGLKPLQIVVGEREAEFA